MKHAEHVVVTVENPVPDGYPYDKSEPSNAMRARWASVAVEGFSAAVGNTKEDQETKLQDLLSDLRHWADANGVDWAQALDCAQTHYVNERLGTFDVDFDKIDQFDIPLTERKDLR